MLKTLKATTNIFDVFITLPSDGVVRNYSFSRTVPYVLGIYLFYCDKKLTRFVCTPSTDMRHLTLGSFLNTVTI